jgi:hypothetical protein
MPESSKFNEFWMPPATLIPGQASQVRHDGSRTFYEFIKIDLKEIGLE